MNFLFTDEQDMIAETLDAMLREHCSAQHLRKMIENNEIFDKARWAALRELGLCGVLVPEAQGGLGLSEVEFVRIAETAGAYLLPEPLITSAGIVVPLMADLSSHAPGLMEIIPALAAGEGCAVLFDQYVPLAGHVAHSKFILEINTDYTIRIDKSESFDCTAQPCADPLSPLFSRGSRAKNVHGGNSADSGYIISQSEPVIAACEIARTRGALFSAAQMTGVAQSALNLAVAYAKEREQFGRPIGVNQAVKHMLAEIQVAIEFVRPVLYTAAALLPAALPTAQMHISNAWLRARDTLQMATEAALQVHGAMGYSWESDVHLYLKRSLVLAQSWGPRDRHLDLMAARAAQSRVFEPEQLFGESLAG